MCFALLSSSKKGRIFFAKWIPSLSAQSPKKGGCNIKGGMQNGDHSGGVHTFSQLSREIESDFGRGGQKWKKKKERKKKLIMDEPKPLTKTATRRSDT